MPKPKRANLLASIDMEAGQGATPPADNIAEIAEHTKPAAKLKPRNVKTSLYLPPEAHRKLKEIALATDCKVHDLVIRGIDKVLAEQGFSSVKELSIK